MAAVIYLDVEDEITSAAARIRGSDENRVALVVPYGSRLATSRINFRLLAREAQTRGRRLAIVAGDAATRALAASAGLPVFGSVGEYETADAQTSVDAPKAAATAATSARPAAAPPPDPDLEKTTVLAVPAPAPVADTGAWHGAADDAVPDVPPFFAPREGRVRGATPDRRPVDDGGGRSVAVAKPARSLRLGRTALAILAGGLAFAVLVGAVAGYVLLPWARVTVTALAQPIGPVELTIKADPTATEVDPAAGVVPAERLTFDLNASATFQATGVRVEQSPATGEVLFQSKDSTGENQVAAGSIVATPNGIRFQTLAAISVPRATIVGLTIIPGEASVAIRAVTNGPNGNVEPNAITVIPPAEDPLLTSVTNPERTSGGRREEFPRVVQADVDAAVAQLTGQLQTNFQSIVADPGTVPEGTTLFPETAATTPPQPTVAVEDLVGQEVATFDLGLTSTGSVVAVDERPLEEIARTRIRSRVQAGHRLVDDSIEVGPAEASVDGEIVSFTLSATAAQIRVLDAAELRNLVKGKTLAEARALLEPFGDVDIQSWPDWVSSIPTVDARFELAVDTDTDTDREPQRSAPPSPRPAAPSASPAASPSSPGGPSPTASPAP
jgi:hypothetical protein